MVDLLCSFIDSPYFYKWNKLFSIYPLKSFSKTCFSIINIIKHLWELTMDEWKSQKVSLTSDSSGDFEKVGHGTREEAIIDFDKL